MDSATPQDLHRAFAERIKSFRTARGITLVGLSALTGIGKSTLSNLERGQGNPTIETIWQLAQVLDVGYGELVGHAAPQASVAAGVSVALVDREDAERRIETFRMRFEAGACRPADAHAAGVREHVLVLRGSLTVATPAGRALLRAGDAWTFAADQTHRYEAGSAGAAALVSVVYPSVRPA
ncbi:XRE family transcriptional regulator [uncultured Salinisphaera sp.]|uniref:helix-turn-helix domain-containing protein n=1 Tax=uncultured Salinisphaera sp. TaxID=359372 RepID=UPI0032B2C153